MLKTQSETWRNSETRHENAHRVRGETEGLHGLQLMGEVSAAVTDDSRSRSEWPGQAD